MSGLFDRVWARLTRAVLLAAGVGILYHETVLSTLDRPWVIAAGVGLAGAPLARYAEEVLGRFTPGGPAPHLPPRKQQDDRSSEDDREQG